MDIIVISILILSIAVYYIYAKLRDREKRVLIKYQAIQLLISKEAPISNEELLTELNTLRQPNEIKIKILNMAIYEMVEAGTLSINKDMKVKLHPRISEMSAVEKVKA